MDTELKNENKTTNPGVGIRNRSRKSTGTGRPKKTDYSGSRWAGLILLVISFIISLIFYARSGAADFFSTVFGPAKYSIQK